MRSRSSSFLVIFSHFIAWSSHHLTLGQTTLGELKDKEILLAFKASITSDPTGFLSNWNKTDNTSCYWSGVQCNFWSKRVIELDFTGKRLAGTIKFGPPSLGRLGYLRTIRFGGNKFSGVIPGKALGNLPALTELDLSGNQFVGPIPLSLTTLTFLTYLDLSANNLTGPLRSRFRKLPRLVKLDLSSNSLSGSLPPLLLNSPNLQYLDVSANSLDGTIPSTWGLNSPQIREIHLENNNLTGSIPRSLGAIPNIRVLELSGNHLSGPLPSTFLNLTELNTLDVSRNNLTGSLSVLDSLVALVHFSANDNNFSGTVQQNSTLSRFPPSSFSGNPLLCFLKCYSPPPSPPPPPKNPPPNPNFPPPFPPNPPPPPPRKPPPPPRYPPKAPPLSPPTPPPVTSPPPSQYPPPPRRSSNGFLTPGVLSATVIGCFGLLVLFLCCLNSLVTSGICGGRNWWKRGGGKGGKKGKSGDHMGTPVVTMFGAKPLRVDDLVGATEQWDEGRIVAKGGLGETFKAVFPDWTKMTVERIEWGERGRKGEGDLEENQEEGGGRSSGDESGFMEQARIVASIKHRHIAPLLGVRANRKDRIVLYEYMAHSTLHEFLHAPSQSERSSRSMKWKYRYKIALGTARGLSYLHNDCIPPMVHGCLSPYSIMLDKAYNARLRDIGLKSYVPKSRGSLSPSERSLVCYASPGQEFGDDPSAKSDVFSFGIVLLELVTGKRPGLPFFEDDDGLTFVKWVRDKLRSGRIDEVFDKRGDLQEFQDEMLQVVKVALLCVAENPERRPLMSEVVEMLMRAREVASKIREIPFARDLLL